MQAHGISPNVGSFVGASTIREYAMGLHMGAAPAAELDTMRAAMRRGMEDGAFGLGSALIYPPGNYASTEELIEIAKAMSPYGGVYITHMRSEADQLARGDRRGDARSARKGGVPVEIYHLKAAGKRNWAKAAQAIAKIDSARAAGLDVQANMYPYTAGGTGLAACLPPSASADGKLFENLADSAKRAKIREDIAHPKSYAESLCELATPEGVLLTAFTQSGEQEVGGTATVRGDGGERARTGSSAVMDLLLTEHQDIGTIYFLMSEENVAMQLKQPWIKIGTDAERPGSGQHDASSRIRASYGTYPRILGKYVRDEHVLRSRMRCGR